jgi:hypothetical protein
VQDDDVIEILVDRGDALRGTINMVGARGERLTPEECASLLASRPVHPALRPHASLPNDTRLWAALQRASGGTWGGCVYDVDRIIEVLDAGLRATEGGASAATPGDHTRLTGAVS